jgi:hypothetical protein
MVYSRTASSDDAVNVSACCRSEGDVSPRAFRSRSATFETAASTPLLSDALLLASASGGSGVAGSIARTSTR